MGDWRSDAKPPVPDIDVEGIRMANEDYAAAVDWQKRAQRVEAELKTLKERLQKMRGYLDAAAAYAMRYGSGGSLVIANSVKTEIDSMLGEPDDQQKRLPNA